MTALPAQPHLVAAPLALLVGLVAMTPTPALAAGPVLTVLPLACRGVTAPTCATFRDLLTGELLRQLGGQVVQPPVDSGGCVEPGCARQAGLSVGAQVVVFGSLTTLGSKTIASITAIDVATGLPRGQQRYSARRVEELDLAAARIAAAVAQATSAPPPTSAQGSGDASSPEARRPVDHGVQLRVGTIVPVGDGYAGAPGAGILFDLSYWLEAKHFVIEPRIGVRFDAVRGDQSYGEVPFDIGAYYLLGPRSFAVLAGGGVGLHYLWETRGDTAVVGNVLPSRTSHLSDDSGWGFGLFARVGLLLARAYSVRLALTAEYHVTFLEINGSRNPQAITAGIGVVY